MFGFLVAFQIIGFVVASSLTDTCYFDPLPSIPPSTDNRTIPWGDPTIQYANGTTCCSSLDEVRGQLNTIDAQLIQLLSTRTSYVREATRFKATIAAVNDPSRNQQVIQGAVDAAPSVHLPQIVAKKVYEAIINSSVLFEECIFDTYVDDCN
ncbi:chorismate mutase [Suillus clintonianus]|uniref:chorismate mutase n=1 Tax=Suillus clintonianus TaxID=1904413 RepID=UPI001B86EB71|nr:chorismate mutase [Suillus clintonianus]KAG2127237.1 chorismate mutase [Suillus clintonianus]